jgi:hypothetical protein
MYLSDLMNSFYGLEAWRGNIPLNMYSAKASRRGIITINEGQESLEKASWTTSNMALFDNLGQIVEQEEP